MAKATPKKKAPRRPLSAVAKWRMSLGLVGVACTAIVLATGAFIRNTLSDIDAPATASENNGPRIEGVNEPLLEAVMAKNAARRDAARALPSEIPDPFGSRPRIVTTPEAPATETAPPTTTANEPGATKNP